MAEGTQKVNAQLSLIHSKAAEFEAAIAPAFNDDGSLAKDFQAKLKSNVGNTVFDAAGSDGSGNPLGTSILATQARFMSGYKEIYGYNPPAEVLAGMQQSIENIYGMRKDVSTGHQILDAAVGELSNSDGIIKRNHLVTLVTPIALTTITGQFATHVPPAFDQTEISWIERKAGTTFGDMIKGDVIDVDMSGQYSSMTQMKIMAATATANQYSYDTAADFGGACPIRKKRASIYIDRGKVAEDNGKGAISGQFTNSTGTTTLVTGTVDYATGVIVITTAAALLAGIVPYVEFDVNIEADPTKIPFIDHQMDSAVLYPHESALVSSSTIQAAMSLSREYNRGLVGMQQSAARNVMAGEKDRNRLNKMYWSVSKTYALAYDSSAPQMNEAVRQIQETLNIVSMEMMLNTKTSGLTHLVGGSSIVAFMKTLPGFVMAPGYRHKPQPHYVGKLWGMYEVFEDARTIRSYDGTTDDRSWKLLGIGKGANYGDSGFLVGDAVPVIEYKHQIGLTLTEQSTFYELAFRDIHPRNGRAYFVEIVVTKQ